jgi:hypothetical protein
MGFSGGRELRPSRQRGGLTQLSHGRKLSLLTAIDKGSEKVDSEMARSCPMRLLEHEANDVALAEGWICVLSEAGTPPGSDAHRTRIDRPTSPTRGRIANPCFGLTMNLKTISNYASELRPLLSREASAPARLVLLWSAQPHASRHHEAAGHGSRCLPDLAARIGFKIRNGTRRRERPLSTRVSDADTRADTYRGLAAD